MSRFLLPFKFKYWGAFMFPLGLLGWYLVQLRIKYKFMQWVDNFPFPFVPILLTIFFFSGLLGLYFLLFSKEKKGDEYVRKIRLESFQFAVLIQLLFFILSFLSMAFFQWEPRNDSGYMVFLILAVFALWFAYVIRFNFVLLRNKLKAQNEK